MVDRVDIDYKYACILFNNYAVFYLEQPSHQTSDALMLTIQADSVRQCWKVCTYIKIHP